MRAFHYVHLRTFAHETEDPTKVEAALRRVADDERLALSTTAVDGSHGNRILIIEADVKAAAAVGRLFAALARDDPSGFASIERTLRERLDENLNFHLRLDKQAAYAGRLALATDDDAITLRAKIRIFERGGDVLESSLRQLEAFFSGVERPLS